MSMDTWITQHESAKGGSGATARLLACCTLLACVPGARAQSEIVLRGGDPGNEGIGEVVTVSFAGVEVRETSSGDNAARTRVLSWDRVAEVRGKLSAEAEPFGEMAKMAWRARVRMERGDLAGAEPLLEQLFAKVRGQQGPTAAMVASGLLRCRLARQAQSAAVEAWLALMASEQQEVLFEREKSDADVRVIPVHDEAWGLSPQLPPIWIKGPALSVVLGAIAGNDVGTSEGHGSNVGSRAGRVAQLYRVSAAFETGEDVVVPERMAGDAGLELVWDVVASRCGTVEQRATAISGLRGRLAPGSPDAAPLPGWTEAWMRVALGRAMIADGEAKKTGADASGMLASLDERNLGIVHLLHVPARLDGVHPYLAGLALAEAAVALDAEGDGEGAGRIRQLFFERYSGHPAQGLAQAVTHALKPATGFGHDKKGGSDRNADTNGPK